MDEFVILDSPHNYATKAKPKRKEKPWNKCDDCGKFISMTAFENGTAIRRLTDVDTAFSCESYETLCPDCRTKD